MKLGYDFILGTMRYSQAYIHSFSSSRFHGMLRALQTPGDRWTGRVREAVRTRFDYRVGLSYKLNGSSFCSFMDVLL